MQFRSRRVSGNANRAASLRFAVAAGVAVILLLSVAVGANANPSIKDKRAQAEAILAEIHGLDEEVGAAAERFNGANYELGKLTSELAETREDLTQARQLQKTSQKRVAVRLRQLYIRGDGGSALPTCGRELRGAGDRILPGVSRGDPDRATLAVGGGRVPRASQFIGTD